jgi:hypothetical protein
MRASPYDLSDMHLIPIKVETAEGRTEYVNEQRRMTQQSVTIRNAIIAYCEQASNLREAFDEEQ